MCGLFQHMQHASSAAASRLHTRLRHPCAAAWFGVQSVNDCLVSYVVHVASSAIPCCSLQPLWQDGGIAPLVRLLNSFVTGSHVCLSIVVFCDVSATPCCWVDRCGKMAA
jgi:hypothetical protein